jgi:polysaccharide export outer membrane protein
MTLSSRLFILLIATLCTTASCTVSKKIPYLQDAASFDRQKIDGGYAIKIENDDLLSIAVSSKDTLLAIPFNRTPGGRGYLVNTSGSIDFPVFGEMKIAGWTPAALADTLRRKIVHGGYIRDPAVSVRLLNFKVSVMGEVNKPGVFPVTTERVTLLEALSMAGDMSIYGKRDKVLVVREEGGQRETHYLDVNSTAIFSSPYYYLRQNDLVYVEPNKARAAESEYSSRLPVLLTAASVLTSLASLIILIAK